MPFITPHLIWDARKNYDFFGGIVKGKLRSGKSSFAIQILAEAYGTPDKPDWNAWKTYLVFKPEEFIEICKEARKSGKQWLMVVWDDAGFWLSAYDWHKELSKEVSRYIQTIATVWACVLFTAPRAKDIITKVRNIPGGHRFNIAHVSPGGDSNRRDLRRARCYEGWASIDEKFEGFKGIYDEFFSVMLPDQVFHEYDKYRRGYVKEGEDLLEEVVNKIRRKEGEQKAETIDQRIRAMIS